MKKLSLSTKKLAIRALTIRDLTAIDGGYIAHEFPRNTAEPSVCPVSCTTTEPAGCATGDNCIILRK